MSIIVLTILIRQPPPPTQSPPEPNPIPTAKNENVHAAPVPTRTQPAIGPEQTQTTTLPCKQLAVWPMTRKLEAGPSPKPTYPRNAGNLSTCLRSRARPALHQYPPTSWRSSHRQLCHRSRLPTYEKTNGRERSQPPSCLLQSKYVIPLVYDTNVLWWDCAYSTFCSACLSWECIPQHGVRNHVAFKEPVILL